MHADNVRHTVLSNMPASRRDRKTPLAVVAGSARLFAIAVPYAGMPLARIPAFVASYQSALALKDIITAVLLFSQFAILRDDRAQRHRFHSSRRSRKRPHGDALGPQRRPARSRRWRPSTAMRLIDLLFTDTIRPGGINGRQPADEALNRRPALKVLYTLGYSEDVVIHQGRLDPGAQAVPQDRACKDDQDRARQLESLSRRDFLI